MSTLLSIQASPRGPRSASTEVASAFAESFRAAHPTNRIVPIDIWETSLPELNGDLLNAAYSHRCGIALSPAEHAAWIALMAIVEQFKSADCYLISVPMWNFSIPYKLKHYIDLIVHSGLTFSYSPDAGFRGLVTGKTLVLVYARGGAYLANPEMQQWDQQSVYLRQIFGFLGIEDIREIFIEPTAFTPDARSDAISDGVHKATAIAESITTEM